MALELCLRSAIVLLLVSALAVAGCDRQSQPQQQADAGAANVAAPQAGGQVDRSHKGEAAPALAFLDPSGAKVTLATFRGRPVLLNLWATWCAPCVKEMPTLDALAGAQGGKLQVVTLSQDFEGAKAVAPFFAKARFRHLRPYLDSDAAFSMTMGLNLPATILYDRAGREVWRKLGDTDWNGPQAAALLGEAG
jgi:thiol-disulfide isomerase/thioredoxin